MLKYEKFYRDKGIRYIRDFIDPVAYIATGIKFPSSSMLFWYNPTQVTKIPTKELPFFSHLNKPKAYVITEYLNKEHTIGDYRQLTHPTSEGVKISKTKEPDFKYLRVGKPATIPNNDEVIFSLGMVNEYYKYTAHPLQPYYVWHNTLVTTTTLTLTATTGPNRHKFLFMELPFNIPNKLEINKYLGTPTRQTLHSFTTPAHYNILELFRFISAEHKEESVLAKVIPAEDYKNVDLVLTINNTVSIVNLELLASMSEAHVATTKIKKYKPTTAFKILYIYLNKLLETTPANNREEHEEHFANVQGIVAGNVDDTKHLETVALDDIIDNELVVPPEVTEVTLADTITTSVVSSLEDDSERKDPGEDTALSDNIDNVKILDKLKDGKVITPAVYKTIKATLDTQMSQPSPYNDGTTIGESLTNKLSEIEFDPKETDIHTNDTVFDKSGSKDVINGLQRTYNKKMYRKDVLSAIYSIQKAGMIVKSHEIEDTSDYLDDSESHKLVLTTLDGNSSTIRLVLPKVREDGSIRKAGNTFIIRKQRADVPLKKIANSVVSINSYYGKLFITRSKFKKDDLGYWFQKKLITQYETDKDLKDISATPVVYPDVVAPKHYGIISRYIRGFTYKKIVFNFDYKLRKSILANIDLSKVEHDSVIVGAKGGVPVTMGFDNQLYVGGEKTTSLGSIFEFLGIDLNAAPVETVSAKIFKKEIPLVVLLSYYVGFKHLLTIIGTKYRTIPAGTRPLLAPDEFKIVFLDITYAVTKDHGAGDLILSGFKAITKQIKNISSGVLDSPSKFSALFTALELPILYANEIKHMGELFIDPITKQLLELYKLPVTFRGVLIKAVDMLLDDNFKHPNDISGSVVKGNERIAGMVYTELVRGLRLTSNRSHFSKSKLSVNPFSVMTAITDDSTTVLVDDLNPIAGLKQIEDVTYLGAHGRKEETMSEITRVMHPSEIGIISEGVKDSGAVGISAYLSSVPKVTTIRGTVGKLEKADGWGNILTTSAMLAPFSTMDDPKRTNFTNIQNGHTIPINGAVIPYVRTGEETVIASKVSDKFAAVALEAGVVLKVTKSEVIVKYAKLGNKKYSLKSWTTKEEAGVTYRHHLAANVTVKQKVKKDDVILYTPSYFEPDYFDTTRVVYRVGKYLTIGLEESPEVYEDSGSITADASKSLVTTINKTKSIRLASKDKIMNAVKIGEVVLTKQPLMGIADASMVNLGSLDKSTKEALMNLKALAPKAGYEGKVVKIRVFYNSELKDLSKSIRDLAIESDKALIAEVGHPGKVTTGYSIQGLSLQEGEVEIKYYIEAAVGMGTGDKAVFGNQLKFTVGKVLKEPNLSEDGVVIAGMFSTRSIEGRIVNSPGLLGTTSKLLEVLTEQVTEEYFK